MEVFCISSVTGEGIADMERFFAEGKTSVLLGSSGVGKSSFVNVLMGTEEMATGGIREADAQGRHTTTYKQCMFLPKEIVLPNGKVLTGGGCCKFADCNHRSEPGCAIRAALEDGTLPEKRWKTYQEMLREEAFSKERKQIMMKKIGKARKELAKRNKSRSK